MRRSINMQTWTGILPHVGKCILFVNDKMMIQFMVYGKQMCSLALFFFFFFFKLVKCSVAGSK